MSVDYYMACTECKEITPIFTVGAGGWKWFCSPEERTPLRFMERHQAHIDKLKIVPEQSEEWDDYRDVEAPYPFDD